MGDPSTKKRKRAHLDAEEADAQLPQKTLVVEKAATASTTPGREPRVPKSQKDGKTRQEKSERRSKKRQKVAAHRSPARDVEEEDAPNPRNEGTQNKHLGANGAEPDTAPPVPETDKSLPVVNGTSTKKKSRTKPASKPTIDSDPNPNTKTEDVQPNPKTQRFILFIGNLPYSATTAQIASHFSKLAPTSIRHSTDKSTGRSKGFAFLEFAGYDKMKTCLKLYHHSIFDAEGSTKEGEDDKNKDKKKAGRRINVELTVGGGGGRSEKRKEKIKGKNLKLEEERERRRVKELEEGEKEAKKKPNNPATDANATLTTGKDIDMGDIHPSRRGRVG